MPNNTNNNGTKITLHVEYLARADLVF